MTYVHLKNVDVSIPVYDSHALRLIRLPAFRDARVGTDTASRSHGVIVIHALKNLSMEVEEGDRVCLIGHNGAGKTTLLRVVAGIYPSTTGSVDVQGQHVRAARRQHRAQQRRHRLREHQADRQSLRLAERADIRIWCARSRSSPSWAYICRCRPASIRRACRHGSHSRSPPHRFLTFCWSTKGSARATRNSRKRRRARVQQFVSRAGSCCSLRIRSICAARCATRRWCLSKGEAVFFGDVEEGFKVYASLS